MPQTMPPMSTPAICRFSKRMPFFRMLSPDRFNDFRLGTRTILKRNKSYISTKYPNAATNTGIRKSCCVIVWEDESVIPIASESFIMSVAYLLIILEFSNRRISNEDFADSWRRPLIYRLYHLLWLVYIILSCCPFQISFQHAHFRKVAPGLSEYFCYNYSLCLFSLHRQRKY